MTAARVHAHLVANGVPVVGVALGEPTDKGTWTVQPASLQNAAQPLIDAFVPPTPAELADEAADRDLNMIAFRALARETYDLIPAYAGKPTVTEFFARIKARYTALL